MGKPLSFARTHSTRRQLGQGNGGFEVGFRLSGLASNVSISLPFVAAGPFGKTESLARP